VSAEIRELFQAQSDAVQNLSAQAQKRALRITQARLKAIRKELQRLEPGSWGYASRAATMRQLQVAVGELAVLQGQALQGHLRKVGGVSARTAAQTLRQLDKHYAGVVRPLRFDTTRWITENAQMASQVRLREYSQSFARYGSRTVSRIEEEIAGTILTGEPWWKARQKVWQATRHVVGDNQWMVDRICRTETAAAYNGTQLAAMMEEDVDPDDRMMKRLVATFDGRTGKDSVMLHGQTVPVDKPFVDPYFGKEYMAPPNRPNDREVIVPWRQSFGEMYAGGSEGFIADTAATDEWGGPVVVAEGKMSAAVQRRLRDLAKRSAQPRSLDEIRRQMVRGQLADLRRQMDQYLKMRTGMTAEEALRLDTTLTGLRRSIAGLEDEGVMLDLRIADAKAKLDMPEGTFAKTHAAAEYGVNPKTVNAAVKKGDLKYIDVELPGGRVVKGFDAQEFHEWARDAKKVRGWDKPFPPKPPPRKPIHKPKPPTPPKPPDPVPPRPPKVPTVDGVAVTDGRLTITRAGASVQDTWGINPKAIKAAIDSGDLKLIKVVGPDGKKTKGFDAAEFQVWARDAKKKRGWKGDHPDITGGKVAPKPEPGPKTPPKPAPKPKGKGKTEPKPKAPKRVLISKTKAAKEVGVPAKDIKAAVARGELTEYGAKKQLDLEEVKAWAAKHQAGPKPGRAMDPARRPGAWRDKTATDIIDRKELLRATKRIDADDLKEGAEVLWKGNIPARVKEIDGQYVVLDVGGGATIETAMERYSVTLYTDSAAFRRHLGEPKSKIEALRRAQARMEAHHHQARRGSPADRLYRDVGDSRPDLAQARTDARVAEFKQDLTREFRVAYSDAKMASTADGAGQLQIGKPPDLPEGLRSPVGMRRDGKPDALAYQPVEVRKEVQRRAKAAGKVQGPSPEWRVFVEDTLQAMHKERSAVVRKAIDADEATFMASRKRQRKAMAEHARRGRKSDYAPKRLDEWEEIGTEIRGTVARETRQLVEDVAWAPDQIDWIQALPPKDESGGTFAFCGPGGGYGGDTAELMANGQRRPLTYFGYGQRSMGNRAQVMHNWEPGVLAHADGKIAHNAIPRGKARKKLMDDLADAGVTGKDAHAEIARSAVVRHEFGHAVDHNLQHLARQGNAEAQAVLDLWENAVKQVNRATWPDLGGRPGKKLRHDAEPKDGTWGQLSRYASSNPRVEGLAEAFAMATFGDWDTIPKPLHRPLQIMLGLLKP